MASVLTSTSQQSSRLYIGLLLLATLGASYFLLFKEPSAQKSYYRQGFQFSFAAFENGIRLAHYQFLADGRTELGATQQNMLINGLYYNPNGFPIAADLTNINQSMPLSAEDCLAVWRTALGPLQPEITLLAANGGYWASIKDDKTCVYQHYELDDLQINYRAIEGKVELFAINR